VTATGLPRRLIEWQLTGGVYLLATLACAAVVYLGTRHHPIAHQRFVTLVVPAAFVLTAVLLLMFLLNRRLSAIPALLVVDLLAWLPLLVLTLGARAGRANVTLWLGVAICLKAAALLIALGRTAAEKRLGDRPAAWLLVAVSILFYVAPVPVVQQYGLIFALSIVFAFVYSIVVMPVLGHATWHLYRKVVGS